MYTFPNQKLSSVTLILVNVGVSSSWVSCWQWKDKINATLIFVFKIWVCMHLPIKQAWSMFTKCQTVDLSVNVKGSSDVSYLGKDVPSLYNHRPKMEITRWDTKRKNIQMQVMELTETDVFWARGDADEKKRRGHSWRVRSPLLTKQESLLEACVYVSLRVFPPTVLHPILLNKGTWGCGVKWEWAHEWKGTNWHVAFCEVSAQPLDRWLPFANEHPGLCVSAFLLLCRMFFLLSSFVQTRSGQRTIGALLIGRSTHQ